MNIGISRPITVSSARDTRKAPPHKLSYGLFEFTDATFTGNQLAQRGLKGNASGLDGSARCRTKPFRTAACA